MASPIVIIHHPIKQGASVVANADDEPIIMNDDTEIAATGFPSYDWAYGYLDAALNALKNR
jgi:hypothetical protein